MGLRLYDPSVGRFFQVDPIEGGNANDYDYGSGDPINRKDLDYRAAIDPLISEVRQAHDEAVPSVLRRHDLRCRSSRDDDRRCGTPGHSGGLPGTSRYATKSGRVWHVRGTGAAPAPNHRRSLGC